MTFTFSDEDLKRLKMAIAYSEETGMIVQSIFNDEWRALLARLESAERVCSTPKECNCSQECDWHSGASREWLKSKGE